MFNTKIEYIAELIVENDNTNSIDKEIVVYGLTSALEQGASILTTAVLGIFFGLLPESLVFLASVSMIRMYAGGYHCEKTTHCYIMSCGIMASVLVVVKFTKACVIPPISVLLLLISVPIILRFAPVGTTNKPLDAVEKQHYREVTIRNLVIESCLILVLLLNDFYQFAFVMSLGIIVTAVFVFFQEKKTTIYKCFKR